jgi:putative heme-binding domain-containing protein
LVPAAAPAAGLELKQGDHVSLIGNTLADRMQYDGWLETLLYERFPDQELSIRNLGFSGDELTLRLRSKDFGTPDEWLTRTQTDVVLAFFGYGESWGDAAGLEKFKTDLVAFIDHTLAQKYNGQSAPRLVICSPIAHEDHHSPNLSDGSDNNRRLEMYTATMQEVCRDKKVPFVDLYHATAIAYPRQSAPLTINGIHLNEHGNQVVARLLVDDLCGAPKKPLDPPALAALRTAVLDKCLHWFQRYRTVDGYSIYGGRADLKFVEGQTNREVAQREMEILDVMTANRDRRIWALLLDSEQKIGDDNTPDFVPVVTNKPGKLPGGKHAFLDGIESLSQMTVAEGMKVNLFASEKEFPELVNPVQMAWDTKGRLWVAVWPTYPHWKPNEPINDKLLIFEDTDSDGQADKCIHFAEDLHCPTGFEFYNGGVIVAQQPNIIFLQDHDGDDKADSRTYLINGMDSADTHHAANSFVLDPGGALYFQEGTFHHTQVETPYGPTERCANAGVFRYVPRTQRFEVYITHGFANPHGHVFDTWGQDIVVDGTGSNPYHAALFSGRLEFPEKHPTPPQVYKQRTRPCPGMEFLSSRHFPEANQGNLLVGNVIGFQGILQYKLSDDGASFSAEEVEPIVSSSDPNFRPSDIKMGPDGAIYFSDWHNPIIGHMQHNLRDPSRDREHGRVYRISYPSRPLLKPTPIAGEPIDKLLGLLKEPEDRVRYRARIELGSRKTPEVIAAAKNWLTALDPKDANYEHQRLEGLWLHQSHNIVDETLLKQVLASPDPRARAAATRVLCYWRDRVGDSLELLKQLAADPHPRVRLEAIRAASFYHEPEAIEVVLVSSDRSSDRFIDFVRGETMKALSPHVSRAIAEGRKIKFTTPAGARYFLRNVSTDNLLKLDRSAEVYRELLLRAGVRDEYRQEAVAGLAKLEKQGELPLLLSLVRSLDQNNTPPDESVLFDLMRNLSSRDPQQLQTVRSDLVSLATDARLPVTRQLGFAALIAADGNVEPAWELAGKSTNRLHDLVSAVPLVRDPALRMSLYPELVSLVANLPPSLRPSENAPAAPVGRFVRIELPGRQRTLTLAEVEVFSDGANVATRGKASQSTTAHGGDAARGIDGNKAGSYSASGQTHTQENTQNPWWELDLGAQLPIESVVVYNRTDGELGSRLEGFNLQVLDQNRKVVFQADKVPAPPTQADFPLGKQSPERTIRRAAMRALTTVRGQEHATFAAIAPWIDDEQDRAAAISALLRVPAHQWPADQAPALLERVLKFIRATPSDQRTTPTALEATQLGEGLAALLPNDEARRVRKELGELGVKVIRLGTVTDQMRYDQDQLVLQAGRKCEIWFENTDLMPHNLVIAQPGSMEELGMLAEAAATQPGALARHYVPESKQVLLSSRLLQPRDSQRLSFTAPNKPGVYPYVCTYPGHWRRMYGSLYVVADVEEYLSDPEAYVAANNLVPQDELLKFNRPRKEWKLEELAESVEQLDHRSLAGAKQMFQVATCVACHKLNGVGTEVGPDLAKLDPKQTPLDILRSLIEPSHKIDEKYQSYTFELDSGLTVTGMIVSESPQQVSVIENPLAKAEPTVISKSEIVAREKSAASIMPKGLLDKLTHEEILDLVAYLVARGDAHSKFFVGKHDHGGGQ